MQVGGGRDDTTTLENATYLGGVAVSEAGPSEGSYLQFVTDPGPQAQAGDLGAFTGGQAPVYVSPSLYPSSSSPSTTTYYDTASIMAGYTQGMYIMIL